MLKPIIQAFLTYEDHWNGMVYDDGDQKNIFSSINHQELLGLTQLRLKYIKFFVDLCAEARDHEPLKEIYKKKLQAFKQVDSVGGQNPLDTKADDTGSTIRNGTMLFELKILFDLSRNKNMEVLSSSIDD